MDRDDKLKNLIREARSESSETAMPSDETIHAYLIGTATDEERREVEKALIESPLLRKHLVEISKDIEYLTGHTEDETAETTRTAGSDMSAAALPTGGIYAGLFSPRYLLPAGLAIAIIALLLFTPMRFNIEQGTVEARGTKLAILYFENLSDPGDPERLGQIATNLLITNLSQSPDITIVSNQRLFETYEALNLSERSVTSRADATRVARKAGATLMLLGTILRSERFELTSEIVDIKTGEVVDAQRVSSALAEDIFDAIDKLTAEVTKDLALKPGKMPPQRIEDITTGSEIAYRHYVEGLDALNRKSREMAAESFYQALKYDSTFALAYMQLAGRTVTTTNEVKKEMIDKALRYSDRSTPQQRAYMRSRRSFVNGDQEMAIRELENLVKDYPMEAKAYKEMGWLYRGLYDYRRALESYRRATAIDSLDKLAFNSLSYCYAYLGEIDSAIVMNDHYIRLAPGDANPYGSRAGLYAWNGRLDDAIRSYKESVRIDPTFYPSWQDLGHVYLFSRDYAAAKETYTKLASMPDRGARSRGRYFLASIPIYQGKLSEGLEALERGMTADELEGDRGGYYRWKLVSKSLIYLEIGDNARAFAAARALHESYVASRPNDLSDWPPKVIHLYATSGHLEEARALMTELEGRLSNANAAYEYAKWLSSGSIQMAEGDFGEAAQSFEKASRNYRLFDVRFLLGLAYLRSGRTERAAEHLEATGRKYSDYRGYLPLWSAKIPYFLGICYEELDRPGDAIEQYEMFVDSWADADPGIPDLEDAKKRLTLLRTGM